MTSAELSALPQPAGPGVLRRSAVMIYESLLLAGIALVVSALARAAYPAIDDHLWILQAAVFGTMGLYFVSCWVLGGQTLAMKAWGLRLVCRDHSLLPWRLAVLRYLLAWHLFVPGLVFAVLVRTHALLSAAAMAGGAFVLLLTLYTDPRRQLLHDRLLGTQVVRWRSS